MRYIFGSRIWPRALFGSLILAAIVVVVPDARAAAADCDRVCLRGVISLYLDALTTHNPGILPVGGTVRFTEDAVELRIGEGLWKSAAHLRSYRQDFLDVHQGIAAAQVVIEEKDSPALLMLRLKVEDRKITEIETQVTRNKEEGAAFDIGALQTPSKLMSLTPARTELASREEAIRIASFYPAGLKVGSFVKVDAPFVPQAYRIENGVIMAGPGCTRAGCENMKTQKIIEHPGLTYRVVAVDEELGIVLLRINFGFTNNYGAGNALIVWEAFKVYGGSIHAVEAFMKIMPASAGSGWE